MFAVLLGVIAAGKTDQIIGQGFFADGEVLERHAMEDLNAAAYRAGKHRIRGVRADHHVEGFLLRLLECQEPPPVHRKRVVEPVQGIAYGFALRILSLIAETSRQPNVHARIALQASVHG